MSSLDIYWTSTVGQPQSPSQSSAQLNRSSSQGGWMGLASKLILGVVHRPFEVCVSECVDTHVHMFTS